MQLLVRHFLAIASLRYLLGLGFIDDTGYMCVKLCPC